jgi:hypothetical protein
MSAAANLPPTQSPLFALPRLSTRNDFPEMILRKTFLFRVFDAQSASAFDDRGFTAHRFRQTSYTTDSILSMSPTASDRGEAAKMHIRNWYHGFGSPWISTTPLWLWAVMECVKRVRSGKEEVSLAVIDISQLEMEGTRRKVFYGMELVQEDMLAKNWTNTPQEILVFGVIPRVAIISVASSDEIIQNLPRYFFKSLVEPTTIAQLIWPHETDWQWFERAQRNLWNNLGECGPTTPMCHAEASHRLAFAMIRPRWDAFIEEIVRDSEDSFQEYKQLYYHNKQMEALSHKAFMASVTWELPQFNEIHEHPEDQYYAAEQHLQKLSKVVNRLAGKIASWGFDWSKDVGDGAWKVVKATILVKKGEKFRKATGRLQFLLQESDEWFEESDGEFEKSGESGEEFEESDKQFAFCNEWRRILDDGM